VPATGRFLFAWPRTIVWVCGPNVVRVPRSIRLEAAGRETPTGRRSTPSRSSADARPRFGERRGRTRGEAETSLCRRRVTLPAASSVTCAPMEITLRGRIGHRGPLRARLGFLAGYLIANLSVMRTDLLPVASIAVIVAL
jgi:hypothetical protein